MALMKNCPSCRKPSFADQLACPWCTTKFTDQEASIDARTKALEMWPGEFQGRVHEWMGATFDTETIRSPIERNHRFLEESLELVQSLGLTQSEAHQLVEYVFGRPKGEPAQEVGGVMVTLAALCNVAGIDATMAGDAELARCWQNIEKIRRKQLGKPKHTKREQSIGPLAEVAAAANDLSREYACSHSQWSYTDWLAMKLIMVRRRFTVACETIARLESKE